MKNELYDSLKRVINLHQYTIKVREDQTKHIFGEDIPQKECIQYYYSF
jgi:hypothetical protein